MTSFYDEVEIEDLEFNEETRIYTYPCPCGDKFQISEEDIFDGEDIARCPSCSLLIRVIYDPSDFERPGDEGGETIEIKQPIAV
ncbi:hypothetical protein SmJEL517_g01457 [Synchytrium microbalum]|uniref:Diphthamide biosynthesis protein 3 n=1 Tax=Synchytrium microbalum TaxID=1806994 RepID=A0A507CFL4_9FUNG|nr:uncharacterized protein SmJEL517_g01457 [Synchytrium microbalum]TPX36375.1 hypothetical protein SmJEL517_g01457 [Synchytrium microbalum]